MSKTLDLIFSYWKSLLYLMRGPEVLKQSLEIPLHSGILRARAASLWTSILLIITCWLTQAKSMQAYVNAKGWGNAYGWIAVVSTLSAMVCSPLLLYGFLRLYTLVNHNMATTIFKTRGQRLRLLNIETNLMSLNVPFLIGYIISRVDSLIGYSIMSLSFVYSVILFGYSYNLIFHKVKWRGTILWLESTILTLFILAIGALALAVAVSVIAFFVLLLLRPFLHH